LRDGNGGGGEVARSGGAQAQVDFVFFAHDLIGLLVNGKNSTRVVRRENGNAASCVKMPKRNTG
jgi:hypothetical protein